MKKRLKTPDLNGNKKKSTLPLLNDKQNKRVPRVVKNINDKTNKNNISKNKSAVNVNKPLSKSPTKKSLKKNLSKKSLVKTPKKST